MSWTRGRDARTRKQRELATRVRRRDPICRCTECPECSSTGCQRPTTQADHILNFIECVRRGLDPDTEDNMQGMCTECHAHKTYLEAKAGRARLKITPRVKKHPSDA